MKSQFDVIGISETREQSNRFLSNVNMNGYVLHSQHSIAQQVEWPYLLNLILITLSGRTYLFLKMNLKHCELK